MKVYLTAIYGDVSKGIDHIIYAWDAKTKELVISANLEYCLDAVKNRNYVLVKEPKKCSSLMTK